MGLVEYIGHRGNQNIDYENSYNAIVDCFNNDLIDGVEIDIRPTKDNEIIVLHNQFIVPGLNVQDYTYNEIKNMIVRNKSRYLAEKVLKTFAYYDRYFLCAYLRQEHMSTRVPLLEDVLDSYDGTTKLLIEIKMGYFEYDPILKRKFVAKIIQMLKDFNYQDKNIVLESFNIDCLLNIKNVLSDIKVIGLEGFLNRNKDMYNKDLNGYSLEFYMLNKKIIEHVLNKNLELYSWDNKRSLEHYYYIKHILKKYEEDFKRLNKHISVINDFPIKARQYIKKV